VKNLLRSPRRLALLGIDVLLLALAFYLAFLLRFEKPGLGSHARYFLLNLPATLLIHLVALQVTGVYRGFWRYASLVDLLNIIRGAALGMVGLSVWVLFTQGYGFPRSVFLLNAILVVGFTGGARFARRIYVERFLASPGRTTGKPVLIVGAGDAADALIRELQHNPRMNYRLAGIADDHPEKLGQELHGVKVLGTVAEIPRLVAEKGAEEVLIATPSATGAQMRKIVESCRRCGVPYRTLPGLADIIDGRVDIHHLRRVRIEDLLRRPPVRLDWEEIGRSLGGARVLVTGAGGSIGSELSRQIARLRPELLILLDHAENSLFYLQEEFGERSLPHCRWEVADITDADRIGALMREFRPQAVFHAAAHKHVPLMEANPAAAFRNNVGGTRIVAEAAQKAGVGKFVMVSTDKAVNPTSVMGLSKRLAELTVQCLGARRGGAGTEFVSVRFGNVMGSEGSVIPLFRRQIEAGGPVTVTHPDVVRYFMTIPEAAQLVLQAAVMGKGGEVFVLDMGEPIRILDLARDMITLSGLEPEVDIPVRFIGLRPGEKLSEELSSAGEGAAPTPHEKIMVLTSAKVDCAVSLESIKALEKALHRSDGGREAIRLAATLVPEYRPSGGLPFTMEPR
jgi:FlaA1/EpsC-like NDP-sugar epimerase